MPARVYVDFINADRHGRVRLTCAGTRRDLASQAITLQDGLALDLYSDDSDETGNPDDLVVRGVVEYSTEENCWVARFDRNAIRHVSEAIGISPAPLLPSAPSSPSPSATT